MTSHSLPSPTADGLARLTREFPVEDVWFLESSQAPQCGLERPFHFIAMVADSAEPHLIETAARKLLQTTHPDFDVHVFGRSVMFRSPRPLLVKMAFSCGLSIFCR